MILRTWKCNISSGWCFAEKEGGAVGNVVAKTRIVLRNHILDTANLTCSLMKSNNFLPHKSSQVDNGYITSYSKSYGDTEFPYKMAFPYKPIAYLTGANGKCNPRLSLTHLDRTRSSPRNSN